MKLKEYILNLIALRLNLGLPIVERNVLGQPVQTRLGVNSESPDYDHAWVYSLITESRIFYDVGCNVGECSLWACLDDPTRRIVAIDANPKALAGAAETLFLNGFSEQAQFRLAFLSDSNGEELSLFTSGTGAAGSRYIPTERQRHSIQVKTRTLDAIVEEAGLVPDFVKMDIEGAEHEALLGARCLAKEHRPKFLVEMHSFPNLPMRENGERVLSWCEDVKYSAYYLKAHSFVTSAETFESRGRCHLLLLPNGTDLPERIPLIQQSDPVALYNK